mmetsp:Transcript_116730/g.316960  ORF Transcript_116730/g.316960 Transcript_116730/m.316960 type:complete len:753 (+) Transcript_116730:99-2357(+)
MRWRKSVVQHAEQGGAPPHPVALVLLPAGELEVGHEVRGMTRGGQRASPQRRLVQRATVPAARLLEPGELVVHDDLQPDDRQLREEDGLLRLAHAGLRLAPAGPLQEEPVDVHAALGRRGGGGGTAAARRPPPQRRGLGEERELVDGDLCLAGVHLLGAGHEALGEEEAGQPEAGRRPLHEPVVHEGDPRLEVGKPGVEGLQARVRDRLPPEGRQLLHQEAAVHLLELRGHHHKALDGFAKTHQGALHPGDKGIEAVQLLPVENPLGDDAPARRLGVRLRVRVSPLQELGRAREEAVRHLGDQLLGALPHAARGRPGLHADDRVQEPLGLLRLRGDLRVGVQAEHLRVLVEREARHEPAHLLDGPLRRGGVGVERAELVAVLQEALVEVAGEEGADEPYVLVVRHAAAVVHLRDDVRQGDPRHARLRLQVHLNLLSRNLEVAVHPLVGHVPSDRAELSPLQDGGVEESKAEEELLELPGFRAALVHLGSDILKRAAEVGPQTLRWLIGDLDAVLQHRHRKGRRGHGCQPQTVHVIDGVRVLLLLDALERRHPTGSQVAILQADPVAALSAVLDQALGLPALALSQRDEVQALLVLEVPGELHERVRGIRAGREDEDQGRRLLRVPEAAQEVERRRHGVEAAQLLPHEPAHAQLQRVLAQRLDQEQALEGRQLALPALRQSILVHRVALRDELLPRRGCGHLAREPLERLAAPRDGQLLEDTQLPPRLLVHPRGTWRILLYRSHNALASLRAA